MDIDRLIIRQPIFGRRTPNGMSISSAYLTTRLLTIWDLSRSGLAQIDIAPKLGISRQVVNQALQETAEKVTKALKETAEISKVEVEGIDPTSGMLVGWSREFSIEAVITLTRSDGMQIWYEHVADCAHCTSA